MEDQNRIPAIAVIILVTVLLSAIVLFVLRKQSMISPLPEGANVKVIFTSPPPSQTPAPTLTPAGSPVPTKKVTPTGTKATNTPKPTAKPTVEPTDTPTP